MSETHVERHFHDLRIPGGCLTCGGELNLRVGPSGAMAFCRQCLRISRPMVVPGPNGPQVAEMAAAA